jgi:hypothetical protein
VIVELSGPVVAPLRPEGRGIGAHWAPVAHQRTETVSGHLAVDPQGIDEGALACVVPANENRDVGLENHSDIAQRAKALNFERPQAKVR